MPISDHAPDALAGLDDIDWPQLLHAYGAAGDVPRWLRALPDPEHAPAALDDLDAAVYHQGGAVYSAGAAALPFLIALACDPAVPHRAAVLELVGRFAALMHEMREPWRSAPSAEECREHLRAGTGRLLRLLSDADPAVRQTAAGVAVSLRNAADDVVSALGRAASDAEEAVRVAAVLALGALAPWLDPAGTALAGVRRQLAAGPESLALLVARNRLAPGSVGAAQFVAALSDPALVPALFPVNLVVWVGTEIGQAPSARTDRTALARHMLTTTLPRFARSASPMQDVGAAMLRWRSVTADLVPDIVRLLDDPVAERRAAAAHLLAAAGEVSRPHAHRLAATAGDPDPAARRCAVWALARLGDPRAVDPLVRSDLFAVSRSYSSGASYGMWNVPGIADVLTPMAAHAGALLPAVRLRLRDAADRPTVFSLTEVLAAWGAAAAPAVPELVALLDTPHAAQAGTALAAIGPAAGFSGGAGDLAAALARTAAAGGPGAASAALALFRVAGDHGPLLATVTAELDGAQDDSPMARSGHMLLGRRLAALGSLAEHHAGRVFALVTQDPRRWTGWECVELAYAHHRMTGDAELCLDVFAAALAPVRQGRQYSVTRQVLRHLARAGGAAEQRFAADLRTVVTRDERLADSAGWRGVAEDDEARDLALAVLRRWGAAAPDEHDDAHHAGG
ncbi:HEAT repeat domain-containing protein [Dactylosporangium sp. NPDC049742]|uniref:HEAT repeat domain-containing protein n=1 Tax=Dactylosporangium sp. NPDC049742 TaxID=3154737 RepID=UPI00342A2539